MDSLLDRGKLSLNTSQYLRRQLRLAADKIVFYFGLVLFLVDQAEKIVGF